MKQWRDDHSYDTLADQGDSYHPEAAAKFARVFGHDVDPAVFDTTALDVDEINDAPGCPGHNVVEQLAPRTRPSPAATNTAPPVLPGRKTRMIAGVQAAQL